jgi:hypothetical protein
MGDMGWLKAEWSQGTSDVKRGDLGSRAKEAPRGVRVPVGAKKRRNWRRAKGDRKVDA